MSESIDIKFKRAAIMLADESSYARAAEKLGISSEELRNEIYALEAQLCLHIFQRRKESMVLTEEGQFLVRAFREAVALHDRTVGKGTGKNQ